MNGNLIVPARQAFIYTSKISAMTGYTGLSAGLAG
jgi:hypothetical protein